MSTLTGRLEFYRHLRIAKKEGPYAWPGGYPKFYVTRDGSVLSHEALESEWNAVRRAIVRGDDPQWEVTGMDANWEDPDLYCDHTGKRIESAYAD